MASSTLADMPVLPSLISNSPLSNDSSQNLNLSNTSSNTSISTLNKVLETQPKSTDSGLGSEKSSTPDDFNKKLPAKIENARKQHNGVEKKRKDQINLWIKKLSEILPSKDVKESKNKILEKAFFYIKELQETKEKLILANSPETQANEIRNLYQRINDLEKINSNYLNLLQSAGITPSVQANEIWNKKPTKYSNKINNQDINFNFPNIINSNEIKQDKNSKKNNKKNNNKNSDMNSINLQNNQMSISSTSSSGIGKPGLQNTPQSSLIVMNDQYQLVNQENDLQSQPSINLLNNPQLQLRPQSTNFQLLPNGQLCSSDSLTGASNLMPGQIIFSQPFINPASAIILPNGQILPVVQNSPNLIYHTNSGLMLTNQSVTQPTNTSQNNQNQTTQKISQSALTSHPLNQTNNMIPSSNTIHLNTLSTNNVNKINSNFTVNNSPVTQVSKPMPTVMNISTSVNSFTSNSTITQPTISLSSVSNNMINNVNNTNLNKNAKNKKSQNKVKKVVTKPDKTIKQPKNNPKKAKKPEQAKKVLSSSDILAKATESIFDFEKLDDMDQLLNDKEFFDSSLASQNDYDKNNSKQSIDNSFSSFKPENNDLNQQSLNSDCNKNEPPAKKKKIAEKETVQDSTNENLISNKTENSETEIEKMLSFNSSNSIENNPENHSTPNQHEDVNFDFSDNNVDKNETANEEIPVILNNLNDVNNEQNNDNNFLSSLSNSDHLSEFLIENQSNNDNSSKIELNNLIDSKNSNNDNVEDIFGNHLSHSINSLTDKNRNFHSHLSTNENEFNNKEIKNNKKSEVSCNTKNDSLEKTNNNLQNFDLNLQNAFKSPLNIINQENDSTKLSSNLNKSTSNYNISSNTTLPNNQSSNSFLSYSAESLITKQNPIQNSNLDFSNTINSSIGDNSFLIKDNLNSNNLIANSTYKNMSVNSQNTAPTNSRLNISYSAESLIHSSSTNTNRDSDNLSKSLKQNEILSINSNQQDCLSDKNNFSNNSDICPNLFNSHHDSPLQTQNNTTSSINNNPIRLNENHEIENIVANLSQPSSVGSHHSSRPPSNSMLSPHPTTQLSRSLNSGNNSLNSSLNKELNSNFSFLNNTVEERNSCSSLFSSNTNNLANHSQKQSNSSFNNLQQTNNRLFNNSNDSAFSSSNPTNDQSSSFFNQFSHTNSSYSINNFSSNSHNAKLSISEPFNYKDNLNSNQNCFQPNTNNQNDLVSSQNNSSNLNNSVNTNKFDVFSNIKTNNLFPNGLFNETSTTSITNTLNNSETSNSTKNVTSKQQGKTNDKSLNNNSKKNSKNSNQNQLYQQQNPSTQNQNIFPDYQNSTNQQQPNSQNRQSQFYLDSSNSLASNNTRSSEFMAYFSMPDFTNSIPSSTSNLLNSRSNNNSETRLNNSDLSLDLLNNKNASFALNPVSTSVSASSTSAFSTNNIVNNNSSSYFFRPQNQNSINNVSTSHSFNLNLANSNSLNQSTNSNTNRPNFNLSNIIPDLNSTNSSSLIITTSPSLTSTNTLNFNRFTSSKISQSFNSSTSLTQANDNNLTRPQNYFNTSVQTTSPMSIDGQSNSQYNSLNTVHSTVPFNILNSSSSDTNIINQHSSLHHLTPNLSSTTSTSTSSTTTGANLNNVSLHLNNRQPIPSSQNTQPLQMQNDAASLSVYRSNSNHRALLDMGTNNTGHVMNSQVFNMPIVGNLSTETSRLNNNQTQINSNGLNMPHVIGQAASVNLTNSNSINNSNNTLMPHSNMTNNHSNPYTSYGSVLPYI